MHIPKTRRGIVPIIAAGIVASMVSLVPAAHATSIVGGPITSAEMMSRAQLWVDNAVPYNQNASAPDPEGRQYRTDCSGYVSMAWHLSDSLVVTDPAPLDFTNVDGSPNTTYDYGIGSFTNLQQGDAMAYPHQHIWLFDSWTDKATGDFNYYAESHPGTVAHGPATSTANIYSDTLEGWPTSGYVGLRYNNLAQPPSAPTPDSDSGWSVYDPNTNATTVFGMGANGRIGYTTGAGTNWPNWSEVSNMWLFPTTAKPTAVYNPDSKTTFVFARGTDGSMGVSTRADGASGWTPWTEMNNYWKLAGDPSAAYNPTTQTMYVFARGSGGHVGFIQSVNGGRWSQWTDVNQSWTFAGDPHAIYNPDTKQVSVFARGNDGSTGVSTYIPGASWPWSNWTELNNYWKLAGDPSAAYNPTTQTMYVFARGSGGHVGFTQSVNGGRWSQWTDVNQSWTFAGDPHAAYNPDTKQVSVFARGNDGSMGVSTYIPGASWPWSNWSELNNYWKLGGDPTIAYSTGAKTMQVFARGQGNPAQMGDTQSVNGGRWTQWNSVNLWWTFVGP
ncbi:hypothetical protein ABH935_008394 [Catenulispora sp. GAS73]|uniref:hypothetical protein n=1 Tax=Catenulispora sp. GAS73 TaxID=3156269 RepID=UPI00351793BD